MTLCKESYTRDMEDVEEDPTWRSVCHLMVALIELREAIDNQTVRLCADQYNELEGWKTRVKKLEAVCNTFYDSGALVGRIERLEQERPGYAPSMEAFLELGARVQKLEAAVNSFPRMAASDLARDLAAFAPRLEAFEAALQQVIDHQGETARLLQALAEKINK